MAKADGPNGMVILRFAVTLLNKSYRLAQLRKLI